MSVWSRALYLSLSLASGLACHVTACRAGGGDSSGGGDIHNVKHVIVVMQENHSFDNYFGALAYAPGSPYHTTAAVGAGCSADDPLCVDGLSCKVNASGGLHCSDANLEE